MKKIVVDAVLSIKFIVAMLLVYGALVGGLRNADDGKVTVSAPAPSPGWAGYAGNASSFPHGNGNCDKYCQMVFLAFRSGIAL